MLFGSKPECFCCSAPTEEVGREKPQDAAAWTASRRQEIQHDGRTAPSDQGKGEIREDKAGGLPWWDGARIAEKEQTGEGEHCENIGKGGANKLDQDSLDADK